MACYGRVDLRVILSLSFDCISVDLSLVSLKHLLQCVKLTILAVIRKNVPNNPNKFDLSRPDLPM